MKPDYRLASASEAIKDNDISRRRQERKDNAQ